MKKLILILLPIMFLTGALVFSCNDEIETTFTGNIFGNVSDKTTGEPIPVASVTLTPGGESVVTGSDGNYYFTEIEEGAYTIEVEKEGYSSASKSIMVYKGENKYDFTIDRVAGEITVDKEVLDFGQTLTTLSFKMVNKAYSDLEYKVEKGDCKWLSTDPQSGTLSSGATETVVVKVDRSLLGTGVKEAMLVVSSTNGKGGQEIKVLAEGGYTASVNTLNVTDVTNTTAKLNGEITDEGTPKYTERGFVYDTEENPTIDNTLSHITSTITSDKKFSYELKNLQTKQTYYVRAYCIQNDAVIYGNQVLFSTVEDAPVLTTLEVEDIASSTATFRGRIDDKGVPPYTERGFVYSTSSRPTYENSLKPIPTAPVSDKAIFEGKVQGLEVGKTYYVRAYAKSEIGYTYSSNEVSFTTQSLAPSVAIGDVTNIMVNSAILHASVNEKGDPAYTERGFCYSTEHNPTIYNEMVVANGSGVLGDFEQQIVLLTPGTTYYVRAYVRVGDNAPIYSSDEKTFTTTDAVPPVVHTNDVTQIGATYATFGGVIDVVGDPAYTERGFCYSTSKSPTIFDTYVAVSGYGVVGEYSKTVTDLLSNQDYYVRAYARVLNNDPVYGEEKSFKTHDNTSKAKVSVTDYVAISNGVGVWFSPSSDTEKYYWKLYKSSEMSSMSDISIKDDLIKNGRPVSTDENVDYLTDCSASTKYTLCAMSTDREGKMGAISMINIETPSSENQPVALINVTTCGDGVADFSLLMSTNCSSYKVLSITATDYDDINYYWDLPDIVYAMAFHQSDSEKLDQNEFYTLDYSGYVFIVTVGYSSDDKMSGVISRKLFNTESGFIMPSSTPSSAKKIKYNDFKKILYGNNIKIEKQ